MLREISYAGGRSDREKYLAHNLAHRTWALCDVRKNAA